MRARHLQLLAGITLAGAALRFATLGVQSYWLDEVATVNILHKGFGDMLSAVSNGESTPPLYYIVAWLWAKVFGTGEVGLRSLSALLGTLTIPLAYVLGRDFVNRATGLVACALAAFSPLLIWYSQEARSYALMVLLTGVSLLALQRALANPTSRRLAAWAVVAIASIATHYYAGFLHGAEAVWLLIAAWRHPRAPRESMRRTLVAVAAVALAAAALLPLVLHQKSTGAARFISESSGLARRVIQIPKQFAIGYQGPAEVLLTVVALLVIAYAVVRVLTAEPLTRSRALALAALGVAAIAAPLVLAFAGQDYLITRNVIAAWLPLAIAASAGLARDRIGYAAAAVLCAAGLVVVIGVDTQEQYQRDDWRGAADFIGKADQPRIVIITPAAGSTPLLHYLPGAVRTPAAGVDVKELVFVGMAARIPGQAPSPPRPPSVGAAGFSETRRQQADTYTVVVEKSPVGTHVGPQVGASSLDGKPALTLYQR